MCARACVEEVGVQKSLDCAGGYDVLISTKKHQKKKKHRSFPLRVMGVEDTHHTPVFFLRTHTLATSAPVTNYCTSHHTVPCHTSPPHASHKYNRQNSHRRHCCTEQPRSSHFCCQIQKALCVCCPCARVGSKSKPR